jgi:hypothetical protein
MQYGIIFCFECLHVRKSLVNSETNRYLQVGSRDFPLVFAPTATSPMTNATGHIVFETSLTWKQGSQFNSNTSFTVTSVGWVSGMRWPLGNRVSSRAMVVG